MERGFLPQQTDEIPAERARWLKAVADVVTEAREQNSPARKASEQAEHEKRLEEAKRKVGMV